MKSTSKGGLKGRETIQGEPDREALGRAAPGGRENTTEKKSPPAPQRALGIKLPLPPKNEKERRPPKEAGPGGISGPQLAVELLHPLGSGVCSPARGGMGLSPAPRRSAAPSWAAVEAVR